MTPPLPRGAAIAIAAAFVLVLVGPSTQASAKVTWNSVGPVRIGMSEAQLRARVGDPATVTSPGLVDVGPRNERVYEFSYPRRKLVVVVAQKRVASVRTTSRAHGTRFGVRVGTSTAKMRRRLRGESCGRAEGRLACHIVRGRATIGFGSQGGRVREVSVGRYGANGS